MTFYKDYKSPIPNGVSGNWKIDRFTVTKEDESFGRLRAVISFSSRGRFVPAGTYTRLTNNGTLVMSDTPDEIKDHWEPIYKAKGTCLLNGLGLGIVTDIILRKPEVEQVWIVENSIGVIDLVFPYFKEKYGNKIVLVLHDALTYKPPKELRFNMVWHDIWNHISTDNLPDMKTLHRKYGKRCDWQGSWCRHWL